MRDEREIDEDSREVGSLAGQLQNLEFEDNVVDKVLKKEAQWPISFSASSSLSTISSVSYYQTLHVVLRFL